jgi:acyl carrier protein
MKTIAEKVTNVIVVELGVAPADVVPTAALGEQLGADSMDALSLTLALEDRFGIEIPDADAIALQTVGDVISLRRTTRRPRRRKGAQPMPEIHVVDDAEDRCVQVWLDIEAEPCEGMIIGLGPTRRAAIDDAIDELRTQIVHLEGLRAGTAEAA